MRRLAVLSLVILFALPLCAQDDAARAKSLIPKLGSEEWSVREKTSRELVGIGEPAREALHDALENDDPEIRVRASNALISIGEEFSFAVECATSESERLSDHGRAALMNLFKIDDPKVLRELSPQEVQPRWNRWDQPFSVMAPPAIALARVQATSGFPILVAEEARADWARLMDQPTANITIRSNAGQISYLRDGLRSWFATGIGNLSPDKQLMPRAMRIGRTNFLYITRNETTSSLPRRCGEQLIADLLGEGDDSVRAALLLAAGAASDSEAAGRIREQYVKNPEITRLMWLAISLGADQATIEQIRARDHADAMALLRSHDWKVTEIGAKYLACLGPDKLGELLSPVIENSNDSLELLAAVWIARGVSVNEAARARIGRLVGSKQDMLAASAARWFAGAAEVSDAELQVIWDAGKFQLLDSSFFTATLELVQRPDIADRLVVTARSAFQANFEPQQARHALAAAVLIGRATPEDLARVLDMLNAARRTWQLASQMAEMFNGCKELPEDSRSKFGKRLFDSDAAVRAVYLQALRKCDKDLRAQVAQEAIAGQVKEDTDVSLPKYAAVARLALKGILVGTGDESALDEIIKAVEGDDVDLAKAGGAAYVDAFNGDALFAALEELNSRDSLTNAGVAALEGYMEICRRAAASQDRVTFRKAYGVASNMQALNQNYQLRNELMSLQGLLAGVSNKDAKDQLLPPDPVLKQLDVAVK